MKRLGELAEIRMGYPFRGRVERVESGGCLLVQMGDVRADSLEVAPHLAHVEAPANWEKHVLNPGDVLLVARGLRNDAAMFVGEALKVIAAPHLFVLRANSSVARAEYLTWLLNQSATQTKIRSIRAGTDIPFVPLEALSLLRVPLPSLELQSRLASIRRLSRQEQELLEQISERRRLLIDATIREAVRREISD